MTDKENFEVCEERPRKAALVAIYKQGEERECKTSLEELARLLETAGGECAVVLTQMRPSPDRRTCIGSGKLLELAEACENNDITLVVFDSELSPSQLREVESELPDGCEVLDRSMLILDIFASHAVSAEGRLQVELAQLKYTAPRLAGKGTDLSRQGGGIGTRGPGETKLETDRRRIRERANALEAELKKLESNRLTMRASRDRAGVKKCAIVGYTNAGKSTLMNALTGAGVLAEDKLFATLDPTTRQYTLPAGSKLLLTDTVGLIRNLPHHLIHAFKSTLDEAVYADMLMIVADASDEEMPAHLTVTENLLAELGAIGKPTLYVFNKCDACDDRELLESAARSATMSGADVIFISAKTGAGLASLAEKLEKLARAGRQLVKLLLPQSEGGYLGVIYDKGDDVRVNYTEKGIEVEAILDEKLRGQLGRFIV